MVDMQNAMVQQMNPQAATVSSATATSPTANKKTDGSTNSSATPLFSQLMKDAQGKTDTTEASKDATKENDILSMLIATAAAMPAALQAKSNVNAQLNSNVSETVVALETGGQAGLILPNGQGNSVNGKNALTNLTVSVGATATQNADQNAVVQQPKTTEVADGFMAKLATALLQDQTVQADATLSGEAKTAKAAQPLMQQDKLLVAQQAMQEVQQQAQTAPAIDTKLTVPIVANETKPLETVVPALTEVLQGKIVENKSVAMAAQDETVVRPETELKAGTINALAQQQNGANGETRQQDFAMATKQDNAESATVQSKPQETPIPFANLLHQHDKATQPVPMTQAQSMPVRTNLADPYQVVGQIVDHAKLLSTNDSNEMVVRLNPEHLGEMTLRVTVANGTVNASFHTDNPEVRRLLEASMMQLRQDLFNQGFKVDNVDVYSGLGHSLPEGQQQGRGGQQEQTSRQGQQQNQEQSFLDSMDALNKEINADVDGVDYRV